MNRFETFTDEELIVLSIFYTRYSPNYCANISKEDSITHSRTATELFQETHRRGL